MSTIGLGGAAKGTGVVLTNIEKAEDAAHVSGDTGVMMLAVRKDTAAALATTDADYIPLIVDASGRLHVLDQNSAAIKTAVELIDNAVAGTELQVDVVAALPAGTNAIGKLAANTGVDIGDVDVTSLPVGNAAMAASTPVTIASDDTILTAIKTAVELIDNSISGSETQVDVVAALPTGTNNIGDVDVAAVTKVHHPFAKGSLTTTGAQYCTAVTGINEDAYDPIDPQTITQPTGYTLEEVEFGLTARLDVSGTPTDNALWKWQASDAGSSWTDLIAEQTLTTPAAATEVSCSGRFAPTGNFLGTGASFQVRLVAKSSGATDTVTAETKNSSYIICRYRRS